MRKRNNRREAYESEPVDQFEAFENYSYTYRHQGHTEEVEDHFLNVEVAHNTQPMHASRLPLKNESPKRSSRATFATLLFLLGILITALVLLESTVFRLETVYVVGNQRKSPQEIAALSGLVRGLNMIAINENEVKDHLKADHTIAFLGMKKQYPSTVYLYIAERVPISLFRKDGIQYTLDADGWVMEESNSLSQPGGMPMVTGFQVSNLLVGQPLGLKTPKQLEAYISIMAELTLQLYMNQISDFNLSDPDNIYLLTIDGIAVRLGDSQNAMAKVGAMRTYMAYIRQLGKKSGLLDISIPHDAKFIPDN